MNEKQYALQLKARYDEAKEQFKHPNILGDLANLKNLYKLDYSKLKTEVEKLDYKLELAENIDIPYWQEQAKIAPYFVFYKDNLDL